MALARALLRARPILMLDEPFAALGPALRAEMLDLVARIRAEQDATLLLVTHDPADARRIADQVVLVDGFRAHPPAETAGALRRPAAGASRLSRRTTSDGDSDSAVEPAVHDQARGKPPTRPGVRPR